MQAMYLCVCVCTNNAENICGGKRGGKLMNCFRVCGAFPPYQYLSSSTEWPDVPTHTHTPTDFNSIFQTINQLSDLTEALHSVQGVQ